MLGVLAQATEARNPILPSSNERLWGAVSVIATLIVAIVLVLLVARYFQRLRRAAEDAATRAGDAEREVVALRAHLTLAGVEGRVGQRASKRRMRRAIGSGALALAVVSGVGALASQDQDAGSRVVTGGTGGVLASASQPRGAAGDNLAPPPPPGAAGATTVGTIVEPPVNAPADQKPVGAPDAVKNAPASPSSESEPAAAPEGLGRPIPTTAPEDRGNVQSPFGPAPESERPAPLPAEEQPTSAEALVAQDPTHRQLCEKPDGSITVIIGRPANPSAPPSSPPAAAGCKGGK